MCTCGTRHDIWNIFKHGNFSIINYEQFILIPVMMTGLFPGQPVSGLAVYSSKKWLNCCSSHTQTQPMCTLEVCKLKDMQEHAWGHTQSHSTWPAEGLVSEKIARLPAVTLHLLSWHIVRWQTGHHAKRPHSHITMDDSRFHTKQTEHKKTFLGFSCSTSVRYVTGYTQL